MLKDIGIGRKSILRRSIIENHALVSTHYIADERFRQPHSLGGSVSHINGDLVSLSRGFRLDMELITSWKDQKPTLGARVLDGYAHDPVNQFSQNQLARDCL